MSEPKPVLVIGGGLAGCEAAWQLAEAGHQVDLMEMRPQRRTPVHTTGNLAELVCSNSLRGDHLSNAVGLLKREMETIGSLVITAARKASVPAGGALAVDRERFARLITEQLECHPQVTVMRQEVEKLPQTPAIIATGPLTSPALHEALESLLGADSLSFFDAVAPIVAADSLEHDRLFRASRYGKGDGADYLNAAMSRSRYEEFLAALKTADKVPFKEFETQDVAYFEGCLPIEVMAERGDDTLRYGPMKPVGLTDPATGRRPWAVVQLRQDDLAAAHWNLVGFQTKLTQSEQKRVFRMIPGLEQARFVRFGMIHRNTFVNAPVHLDSLLRLRQRPVLRLAGQLTGVEGYVESAATGLMAGLYMATELCGREPVAPPVGTAMGGLIRHLTARCPAGFQPANITWGLIPCDESLISVRKRRERRLLQAERALELIRGWGEAGPGGGRQVAGDGCSG
jgi:methylenetetrahydrofolate--tRNA-(uracil-5-)-methyltransferase